MLKEFMSDLTIISVLTVINSFFLVYYLIPKISWIIKNLNLQEKPNKRSSHASETPTMAGIAFFLTIIMTSFFIQNFDTDAVGLNLIASLTLIFMVGVKDDLVISTPRAKLVAEVIAILFLLLSEHTQIDSLHGFLGVYEIPVVVSYVITTIMMLTIINAYNLIDGIDGLAAIVAIVIFSVFALVFYTTMYYYYFLICLCFIGILLAYLNFNFSTTRKIFMGDTGSLIIGFAIGFCALKYLSMDVSNFTYFKLQVQNELIVLAAILWIPLFDLFRIIIIRLYHKKNPFSPDRNHAHHILIDAGLSHFETTMILGFLNYGIIILVIWLSAHWNYPQMLAVLISLFTAGVFLLSLINKRTIKKNKKINSL